MAPVDETHLELFEVPCLVIHLDLQSINLEELSTFLRLVIALVGSSGVGQISKKLFLISSIKVNFRVRRTNLCQSVILLPVEP